MSVVNVSRRGALQALGGGLFVAFGLPGCGARLAPYDPTIDLGPDAGGPPVDLNAWIRIAPDGVVTLRMGAAEMGQGVFTSLPMLLAEELDCDWAQVSAESAPAHKDYRRTSPTFPVDIQLTGGSESVRGYWPVLREAGAAARAMLVAAAAREWGVDARDCTTDRGVVRCGDRSATYGQLAARAAEERPPRHPTLKSPDDFRLVGTSPARRDLPPKVDGTATFGVDVKLDGMLVGTVLPNPQYGGRFASMDDPAARAMPGVVDILAFDQEVVVLADSFWQARQAAAAVRVTWDKGDGAGLDDAGVRAALAAALDGRKAILVQAEGEAPGTGKVVEARYESPYLDHAQLEPLSCTAHVTDDRCDVWVGTRAQAMSRTTAAKVSGVPKDRCFVHTTFLGGGFGRRGEQDFVRLAVAASKAVGLPVKLIWTREASFARGTHRPATMADLRAELSQTGIAAFSARIAGQNILDRFLPGMHAHSVFGSMPLHEGLSESPYHFPAVRVEAALSTCRSPSGGGGPSKAATTHSTASASSTSAPKPSAATRSSSGASCWLTTRATAPSSMPLSRSRASREPPSPAASRCSRASAPSAPRWSTSRSREAMCASTTSTPPSTAVGSCTPTAWPRRSWAPSPWASP